jgi:hypothetical protein
MHTFEKMPELLEKNLEKLFEAWAARKANQAKG